MSSRVKLLLLSLVSLSCSKSMPGYGLFIKKSVGSPFPKECVSLVLANHFPKVELREYESSGSTIPAFTAFASNNVGLQVPSTGEVSQYFQVVWKTFKSHTEEIGVNVYFDEMAFVGLDAEKKKLFVKLWEERKYQAKLVLENLSKTCNFKYLSSDVSIRCIGTSAEYGLCSE